MAFPMDFGDCETPHLISPSPLFGSTSGRFNYQYNKNNSYRDNRSGVLDDFQREFKISPGKYEVKERSTYSVNPPQLNISKILYVGDEKQTQRKKKPAIDMPKKRKAKTMKLKDNSKVKIKIFLEKFDSGVFVTKVKVGDRVRWQNVKYEKQALRYHPALKKFQSVMSAVGTVKLHKTLQISLKQKEAERYKIGDLLEEKEKSQLKPKNGIKYQQKQMNNYYQVNNYMCNAEPSTSTQSIAEISESDNSTDQIFSSDYSTD